MSDDELSLKSIYYIFNKWIHLVMKNMAQNFRVTLDYCMHDTIACVVHGPILASWSGIIV